MICPEFNGQCFGYCITADWMHPEPLRGERVTGRECYLFFTVLINQGVMADVNKWAG